MALLTIGFLAITLLSANLCGLPLVGSLFCGQQDVELTYWGLWEDADTVNSMLEDFVEAYQSDNPGVNLSVTYEKRSFGSLDQYRETLLTRLQQGTGPDLFRIHNSWVEEFSGELSPLPADVLSEEEYALRFYPAALTSARFDAEILAIPLEYDGLVVFYNEALFEGVNVAETIQTWEDFRREAVRLTTWEDNDAARGRIVRAGAAIGTAENVSHSSDVLGLFFAQSGLDPLTDLETQAAADALTFYTNFSTQDRVWDSTLPFSINAFANGQVAMIVAPSWRALDILNLNPQLEFSAIPVPQLPAAQEGGIHWATFWTEGVNADSVNAEVAWKLLEFLTREEQQRTFFSAASQVRAFGEPYAVRTLAAELSENGILAPLLASAPFAVSSKAADASGYSAYSDAFKQAVADVLAGEDPAEALQTTQATINQLEQ